MSSISSHALDTALGRPARNLPVRLDRLEPDETWSTLSHALTDDDGRIRQLLSEDALVPGTYRVTFDTGTYFGASDRPVFYPQVDVVFVVERDQHYHVPLLLSPFGYSTYRGS